MRRRSIVAILVILIIATSSSIGTMPAVAVTYVAIKPAQELASDVGAAATVADSSGVLHTAFARPRAGGAWYGTNKSGAWVFTRLTTTLPTGHPAIAVDGSGIAYVAFANDGSTPGIRYFTDRSGVWVGARLTTSADDHAPSIVVDPLGEVHIVFARLGSIRYLTNRRGYWSSLTLAQGADHPSIALDSERRVHVVFETSGGIRYVTDRSGSWVDSTVTTDGGVPSIATRGTTPTVAFLRNAPASNGLYVATKASTWAATRVVNTQVGYEDVPSLRMDAAGKVHIAYTRVGSPTIVEYVTNASGSWVRAGLGRGAGPSMLLGPGGIKHFTFSLGSLLLRSSNMPSWKAGLASSSTQDVQPDIATAPSGSPRLVYRITGVNPGLRAGTWNGSGFDVVRITYQEDAQPSMAIDAGGVSHIAFVRGGNQLWHASDSGGIWSFEPVDGADTISCPSIAVGSDGHVQIAAFRSHSESGYIFPRVAWYTNATGSFVLREDLPIESFPDCPDLALGAGDTPNLAYGNGVDLTYAHLDGPSWVSERFGDPSDHGPRIEVKPNGTIAIAYLKRASDYAAASLHVRTDVAGRITTKLLSWTENQPFGMAMDDVGAIHLSFGGHGIDYGLRYATDAGGMWRVLRLRDQYLTRSTAAVTGAGDPEILYLQPVAGAGTAAGLIHVRK